jgi:hypothetical protein
MSAVQIHLECAEVAAVEHYAESLGVNPEDIAYAALHQLMLRAQDPEVQHAIVITRSSRYASLPPWSEPKRTTRHPFHDEAATHSLSRFF